MEKYARRVRGRSAGSLCVAAAVAVSLVACGGGSKSPTSPTPTPPVAPPVPTTKTTENPLGSSNNVEARTSQAPPAGVGSGATVFDDFTFTGGAQIRRVSWQGIYCREVANAPAPGPTATGFVIAFYADQAGRPNTASPLYQVTVPLSGVSETLDRTQANLNCGGIPTTWAFYSYSTVLPSVFGADPGRTYWLSIQAQVPAQQPFWGWRDGIVDNRNSLQLFQGTFTAFPVDRAYGIGQ
jgi:hypothetical protein